MTTLNTPRLGALAANSQGSSVLRPRCIRHRARPCAASPAAQERTSLVPDTLEAMEGDAELQTTLAALAQRGQAALTREERLQRQRSLDVLGVPPFEQVLRDAGCAPLRRTAAPAIFQLNIGLYCNQACTHCHVESSPKRTEAMDERTARRCIELLAQARAEGGGGQTLDITGGAPEFNPQFRYLVQKARALGAEVIDRCNLTVLLEPGQEDTAAFLAQQGVRIVASLPCYSASNVDKQRGAKVFERSIQALQLLNSLGYGEPGSGLQLDLVYNPGGAFLAPPQSSLEPLYRQELGEAYGIKFNSLLCLNNMPIKRFADHLARTGAMQEYLQLLVNSFNPGAAEGVMCRDTVSVRWDGALYDCDFNAQMDMPIMARGAAATNGSNAERQHAHAHATTSSSNSDNSSSSGSGGSGRVLTVWDISSLQDLASLRIRADNHCFGCTAGSGSSCQGATAA